MKNLKIGVCVATICLGMAAAGCGVGGVGGVRGSGTAKSETRNVSGFKKIKAGGAVNLQVTAQKDFGLTIEADDNLLELVKTEVAGDTLIVSTKENTSAKTKTNLKISLPELAALDISGASSAVVTGVKTGSLDLKASGASEIKIDGEITSLKADASGASEIDAESLRAENAEVDATGASSVTVSAANDLKADASGASTVSYTGTPKNIQQNSSGASSVKKK